jgi:hypothetical protein
MRSCTCLELGENTRREMECTEAMSKSRMLGSLVCEVCEAELTDASQALKFRRIDESRNQLTLRGVSLETNYVVNRVPVYPFRRRHSL